MGGFGSGRLRTKRTVEECDCLVVNVNDVIRWVRRALREHGYHSLPPGSQAQTRRSLWNGPGMANASPVSS